MFLGTWFKFLPKSGGRVTVKSLHDGNEEAYFSVYDDKCTKLIKGDSGKFFYFDVKKDVEYRIFATGKFSLKGEDDYDCLKAEQIESFPYTYKGSTYGYPFIVSDCTGGDAQGLWFKLVGNGKKFFISMSEKGSSTWDTIISVFENCFGGVPVTCLDHITSIDPLGSMMILDAKKGSTYTIFAGTHSPDVGINFTLSIVMYDSEDNSQCENGTMVPRLPYSFSGTTINKRLSSKNCYGGIHRKGAWFRYTNTDIQNMSRQMVLISTCDHSMNMLKADIEVFQGCKNETCVTLGPYDDRVGCTSAIINAEPLEEYNIFITSTDLSDPGDYYHIDFLKLDSDSHGNCLSPAWCKNLPCAILGHTIEARYSWDECSGDTLQGYWAVVAGTGKRMYATTRGEKTSYPTSISVYPHCPNLTSSTPCLAHSESSSTVHTSVTWDTIPNRLYFIFVSGNNGTTGIFTLKISEAEPPVNAKCLTPNFMHEIPSTKYSSTVFANYSDSECLPGIKRKGTWHVVPGKSHYIRASTCDTMTDFGTKIEVYTGCDSERTGGTTCVETIRDGSCGSKDIVTFRASRNKLYWIFVTASEDSDSDSGFYSLQLTTEEYFFELTKPIIYYVFIVFFIVYALFSCIGFVTAIVAFIYANLKKGRDGYLRVVKL